MKLAEFLASNDSELYRMGGKRCPSVRCNSLNKTGKSFNAQMTPDQATDLARYILDKAQLIRSKGLEDATVQLWNVGENSETISLGLMPERKGPRRKKRPASSTR